MMNRIDEKSIPVFIKPVFIHDKPLATTDLILMQPLSANDRSAPAIRRFTRAERNQPDHRAGGGRVDCGRIGSRENHPAPNPRHPRPARRGRLCTMAGQDVFTLNDSRDLAQFSQRARLASCFSSITCCRSLRPSKTCVCRASLPVRMRKRFGSGLRHCSIRWGCNSRQNHVPSQNVGGGAAAGGRGPCPH